MSTFKITLISIFAACIVIGIIVFAMQKSSGSIGHADLVIWGTIPQDTFSAAYNASTIHDNKNVTIAYVQKNKSTFDADFVQALADGKGPDIVLLRDDLVYKERNRLFPIPFTNFSERTFKDTFIQEGEMFVTPKGILAVPFIVDPLVMYWNRDLFSNNLISLPPKYWDQFTDSKSISGGQTGLISSITRKDTNANITQSALALGQWDNISNSKEIITTLLLQAGTPISARNPEGNVFSALNTNPTEEPLDPATTAMNFYTQFSNPTSPVYTWNASLPTSLNFFLSGNLATYFGFASELFDIQQKNPNLNFDVTYMPQIRPLGSQTGKQKVTGHIYSFSIVKQSKSISAAFTAITSFVEPAALKNVDAITNLPPVRRDMLASKPTNPYQVVFYNSALISSGWIDPDNDASNKIFRAMIQSINNGSARVSEAIIRAQDSLSLLY